MRIIVKNVMGHIRLPEPTNIVMCTDCGGLFSTQIYQPYLRLIATVFEAYHVHRVRDYHLLVICPVCGTKSVMSFDIEPDMIMSPDEGIDARFMDIPVTSHYLS